MSFVRYSDQSVTLGSDMVFGFYIQSLFKGKTSTSVYAKFGTTSNKVIVINLLLLVDAKLFSTADCTLRIEGAFTRHWNYS